MSTKKPTPTPRTPEETWKALEAQAREDEIDRFLTATPAEVDARLRASGHDPNALREEGKKVAAEASVDRKRLAWQIEAAVGLAKEQARVDARSRATDYAGLSRSELLARLAAAKQNPRLPQPVAVLFRNRKAEEASEDELREMLQEIEALEGRED
jgi:hypothetical protein